MKKQKILFQIEAQSEDVGNEDPIFVLEDPDDKDQIFFSFDQKTNICGHMSNKNDFLRRFQGAESDFYFCKHKSCKTDHDIKFKLTDNISFDHKSYGAFGINDLPMLLEKVINRELNSREPLKYMLYLEKITVEDIIFHYKTKILLLEQEKKEYRNRMPAADSFNTKQTIFESRIKNIADSVGQLILSFQYNGYDIKNSNWNFDMISKYMNDIPQFQRSEKKVQKNTISKFFNIINTVVPSLVIFLFDIEYNYVTLFGKRNLILNSASTIAKNFTECYCRFLSFNDIGEISEQDLTYTNENDSITDIKNSNSLTKFYEFLRINQYVGNKDYDKEISIKLRKEILNSIEITYGSFLRHLADESKKYRNDEISHQLMEQCFKVMFVETDRSSFFISQTKFTTSFSLASIPHALLFFAKNIDFANENNVSYVFQKINERDIFYALEQIYYNDKSPVLFGSKGDNFKLSKLPSHTIKDMESFYNTIKMASSRIFIFYNVDISTDDDQTRKRQKVNFLFRDNSNTKTFKKF